MASQVVIAGGKFDGPDKIRLKLHEEYGRVWLYTANEDGTSKQNGRLLCIDDDGTLRIHASHTVYMTAKRLLSYIHIKWPK